MEMTELGDGISYQIQGRTLTIKIDLSQTHGKSGILESISVNKPLSYKGGQVSLVVNVFKRVKRRKMNS